MKQHNFYSMYLSDSKVYLINHLKEISTLCQSKGIKADLDCLTLELSLKKDNLQYDMYPQFLEIENSAPRYTKNFNQESVCFIGWRPYYALKNRLFEDKIEEKALFTKADINIPNSSTEPEFSNKPVIVKSLRGAFNGGIHGPFQSPFEYPITTGDDQYYEEFKYGNIIKLNYWNEKPVFIESQAMPTLQGNGKNTILELATQQAKARDRTIDLELLDEMVCFHDLEIDTILPNEKSILIDFRYESSVSLLHSVKEYILPNSSYDKYMLQFEKLGKLIFDTVKSRVPFLYYSVDFIEDKNNTLWGLEINTNPCVHFCAYDHMLETLLGVDKK